MKVWLPKNMNCPSPLKKKTCPLRNLNKIFLKNIVVSRKKIIRLQIDYTSFTITPLKFITFVKIIQEISLVVLIKFLFKACG